MHETAPSVLTATDLAQILGVPRHRVLYVLRSRPDIAPEFRAGKTRIYPRSVIEIVRSELHEVDAGAVRRRRAKPKMGTYLYVPRRAVRLASQFQISFIAYQFLLLICHDYDFNGDHGDPEGISVEYVNDTFLPPYYEVDPGAAARAAEELITLKIIEIVGTGVSRFYKLIWE